MSARAVLFDLGNTLVSYYAAADFPPILSACLHACVGVLPADTRLDERDLERRALPWESCVRLASLLGIRAVDAVFVGDDPRWDVLGAQRAGLKAIVLSKKPFEGVLTVSGLGEALEKI